MKRTCLTMNGNLNRVSRAALVLLAAVPWAVFAGWVPVPQGTYDHPAIQYATSRPADPVALLQERIDASEVTLDYDAGWGYLRAVLEQLDVPVNSQSLVFSKTSLQVENIGPRAPRALYFNDDVFVGAVRDGTVLELASMDPRLGPVFYILDQDGETPPRFERRVSECLLCHDSPTGPAGVPGLIMLSVLSDARGFPVSLEHLVVTEDETPLEERWGGWYVTGTSGNQIHRGNHVVDRSLGETRTYPENANWTTTSNLTALDPYFDTGVYLSGHSDIVALMVLGHQTRIQNAITRANYEVRAAIHDETVSGALTPGEGQIRIESAMNALLDAMLIADRAPLTSPVRGTTRFAEEFEARGPRDSLGRSLRDLDLERKLFRYPMSFLIYSDAFDDIPERGRRFFYDRLSERLAEAPAAPPFDPLAPGDRRAVVEILEETKPDFGSR